MFQNQRYLTRGIQIEIPPELQLFIWGCIDQLPPERDYLQVFRLEETGGMQRISHESEQPKFHREFLIPSASPITQKLYVIDDGDHSTMLLASEY